MLNCLRNSGRRPPFISLFGRFDGLRYQDADGSLQRIEDFIVLRHLRSLSAYGGVELRVIHILHDLRSRWRVTQLDAMHARNPREILYKHLVRHPKRFDLLECVLTHRSTADVL
ncbi:hypothetical protein D3C71_1870770 [compost metagenome]